MTTCPWPGCTTALPSPDWFLCLDHWHALPAPMQSDIRRTWAVRVDALNEYRDVVSNSEDREMRQRYRAAASVAKAEHEATKARVIEAAQGVGK